MHTGNHHSHTSNTAHSAASVTREKRSDNILLFPGAFMPSGNTSDALAAPAPAQKAAADSYEDITFPEWADIWYEDYKNQVQPSTYANYRYILDTVKERFKGRTLSSIKPIEIRRYCDLLQQKGYSQSYITKRRAILIQIFDSAVANEITSRNPARQAKASRTLRTVPNQEQSGSKKASFTAEERQILLERLPKDKIGHSIRFLLGTGIRVQELLALTPEDIAEDGSSVSILKAIETVNGTPVLGPTKSSAGERVVPIPERYRESALYLRSHSGPVYIWTSNRESMYYDVNVFRKKYYKELDKLPGVRRLTPHCCRHTYVTILEKNHVPMEVIARLVGHSKITTTNIYLHIDQDSFADAVSVLNEQS